MMKINSKRKLKNDRHAYRFLVDNFLLEITRYSDKIQKIFY